jgi:hypothetical protein
MNASANVGPNVSEREIEMWKEIKKRTLNLFHDKYYVRIDVNKLESAFGPYFNLIFHECLLYGTSQHVFVPF